MAACRVKAVATVSVWRTSRSGTDSISCSGASRFVRPDSALSVFLLKLRPFPVLSGCVSAKYTKYIVVVLFGFFRALLLPACVFLSFFFSGLRSSLSRPGVQVRRDPALPGGVERPVAQPPEARLERGPRVGARVHPPRGAAAAAEPLPAPPQGPAGPRQRPRPRAAQGRVRRAHAGAAQAPGFCEHEGAAVLGSFCAAALLSWMVRQPRHLRGACMYKYRDSSFNRLSCLS